MSMAIPELCDTLQSLPLNRPIVLHNARCPYCGVNLDPSTTTKEHVIGRRFVPRGKLHQQWNLILRACRPCNTAKSDLEDDISAITMHPNSWGQFPVDDLALVKEAARKAKTHSRRTGKPVSASREELKITVPFMGNGTMTIEMSSSPQIQSERAFALAQMQVSAFFHLVTYNKETGTGGYMLGGYYPILEARRSDWGNPLFRAFMDNVVEWEPRFVGPGADGFFKIIIRRHPELICFSWAVEWNHSYRVIGLAGEEADVRLAATFLPELETQTVLDTPNQKLRTRHEVALRDEDDRMFYWP